ncbi:MAG: D-serine ammonia-lyase [Chitinophagaceae bacterium]|nr:D-serine ammonia-lyase [Chitinophagaceae bacterium]
MPTFKNLDEWIKKFPELGPVINLEPVTWINRGKWKMSEELKSLPGNISMEDGRRFMDRYSFYLEKAFPEVLEGGGKIISPLREIKTFWNFRNNLSNTPVDGRLFLKCDHALPVAGSIKARGGFFEVLSFAHRLAVKEGLIGEEEAGDFSLPKFKALFSKYCIGVGSTGNLGLSIGIISAKLGFRVNVYMSHDAKEWKKDLLRQKGANVIEEKGDFGVAISKGRAETLGNPYGYFVDDENSKKLFLGYSLAAYEIQSQLQEAGILVNKDHPLFVYSPCGVGGSPGGVMWGLKNLFGDAVHSFFAEPTHSPSVLVGLITGKMERVCVQDFGIDNHTEADGLAVGRPSAFATGIIKKLVSGIYTLNDNSLFELLRNLYDTENIFIEPSATAGLIGPEKILGSTYLSDHKIDPSKITHIAWSTGGGLLPANVRNELLKP